MTIETFDDLWDFGNPAETERRFREVLPHAEGDPDFHAQLMTQIARTLGLAGSFDEAHGTLDQAKRLIDEGGAAHPRTSIRYLLERGRVFNSSGAPETARPLFIEAWDQGLAANEDEFAVDAAHMVAIVEGDGDEALEWNRKGMELAERSDNPRARRWLGSLYNNVGYTLLCRKEYAASLDAYQKGLDWRLANGGGPVGIRIARWCVARALRGLGRIDEALAMQRDLQHEWDREGGASGYVSEEIAECLIALNREEEAVPHFARAHELLSQDAWFAKNEPVRLERLRSLGAGAE